MSASRPFRLRLWHPIAALTLVCWTLVAVVVFIVWQTFARAFS